MSETTQNPLAPANNVPRSDEELATFQSRERRKKKRMKCLAYIIAFAIFQTAIILVFALTVMRIKMPKVRLGTVTVVNTTTSGNLRLTVHVMVKNTNFGNYKFDNTTSTITSEGVTVGQFVIPKGRAKARSTKKFNIEVDVDFSSRGNIDSGILVLSSQAKLSGKVELMKVMKKKKSGEMSCTMSINLSTNAVQDLKCK